MKDYKVRDLTNDEIEKANKRLAEKVAYIQKKLDRRTLLEGLAEEASELSKAALKVQSSLSLYVAPRSMAIPKPERPALNSSMPLMRRRLVSCPVAGSR